MAYKIPGPTFVYRTFARIGAEKVPDAKTLGRLGQVVGPEVVADFTSAWSRSQ